MQHTLLSRGWAGWARWFGLAGLALLVLLWLNVPVATHAENERVITIYHDGAEQTIVTDAATVGEALQRAEVPLYEHDAVEPASDTKLIAPSYHINVYRARPVTVIDGANRYEVVTPHTSARQIAADAGLKLYDEDAYELTRINDFVAEDNLGLKLTITRSVPLKLLLYGKEVQMRTLASTIGEFLKEKQLEQMAGDQLWPAADTPITANMTVALYAKGTMEITEEPVAFSVKTIQDADQPLGYKEIQAEGQDGRRFVIYRVEDGVRHEVQSYVLVQPKDQVEIVGTRASGDGLTKAKGVNYFVDSQGVGHRETFYDLGMNGVMGFCGGGSYSIRADGAKIDQDGYILVAANLNRYPRCSIVETSLGLGKVYDTGGFATVHPDGFDLATDWSNYDGR